MSNPPVDINQIKQSAAKGHFRSIALWLNYPLVPQGIYAQVQPDLNAGYVQILLEFERSPKKDVLVRLVCSRICRLESSLIRGVSLIGRLVGTKRPLWQQRVHLTQRKSASAVASEPKPPSTTEAARVSKEAATIQKPNADTADVASDETITTDTCNSELLKAVPSYLIPKESNSQERRRRQNHSVAPFPVVQIRPADITNQTPAQRRSQRRRLAPKDVLEQQFKYVRAIVVTGSAAAAFILGCVTEGIVSKRGQVAQKGTPSLPTFSGDSGWRPLSDVEAQEIAYRSAMRGPAVNAALESVAVMPHKPITDPEDPTVTLIFGGEVSVGDVPLQTPDAMGKVLGDLGAFQDADIAMVGLGNSLASADTSLQENYLDRTRPDAVDALIKGGIDIVGLTGDQTMEFGRQGLTETLEALDGAGIYRVGAGRNYQEARRPEVLEVKGQRIAYLSYAPSSSDVARVDRAGLNSQERDGIIEDIAALRQAVDWIVVNYRWYDALDLEPNQQQVDLSRAAIDAGADLVVGYHAEQLQGAELYKSRPIVYSLGDFVFQENPLEDHDTATLRVSLRDKQMKVEFLPVSIREARPQSASGETATAILKQIRKASDTFSSPLQFPAILEAAPRNDSLLQPEKTTPLKTLGELEPSPDDWSQEGAPTFDVFDPPMPEGGEWGDFDPSLDMMTPAPMESLPPEDHGLGHELDELLNTDGYGSNTTPLPVESSTDLYHLPLEQPTDDSPFDSFSTQSEPSAVDVPADGEIWEAPTPTKPELEPKTNTASEEDTVPIDQLLDGEMDPWADDIEKSIEDNNAPSTQSDEILSPDDHSLPGYDTLEDWGEKASPHKEFSPIQEQLDSLGLSNSDTESLPAASEESPPPDAISPHDEPLVGPLS